MTNKAEQPTITQADIDAAKLYFGPWKQDEIGVGEGDPLVLAFARHRTASLAAMALGGQSNLHKAQINASTQALKPCYFCGNDGKKEDVFEPLIVVKETDQRVPWFHVLCDRDVCHARGPARRSIGEAIAAWNNRAAECDAIVRWLRQCREDQLAYHRQVYFDEDDDVLDAITTAADTFDYAADQIERGYHLKESTHE